jgi:hypothetical protein
MRGYVRLMKIWLRKFNCYHPCKIAWKLNGKDISEKNFIKNFKTGMA